MSLADKVHNARAIVRDFLEIGDQLWGRFNGKRDGTIWYYSTLAEIFGEKKPGYLATELRSMVSVMKEPRSAL